MARPGLCLAAVVLFGGRGVHDFADYFFGARFVLGKNEKPGIAQLI
jgi:hypothetical protein